MKPSYTGFVAHPATSTKYPPTGRDHILFFTNSNLVTLQELARKLARKLARELARKLARKLARELTRN